MKTVMFYSPRGGTGRSICLANCAVSIAQGGSRVLALDLDIEAGGLNIIFKGSEAITQKQHDSSPRGLVKCLIEQEMEGIKGVIEDLKEIELYKSIGSGDLHLIPIYINTDAMDMIQLKWSRSNEFTGILMQLKQTIVDNFDYDFLLVDLPTGFNHIKECFRAISDLAVVLSRPNIQGAYGARMNLDEFDDVGLKTIFALSCVPSPTKSIKKINIFKKNAGIADIEVIIPFDNELAFSEEISVITRPSSELAKAYKEIAKKIKEV